MRLCPTLLLLAALAVPAISAPKKNRRPDEVDPAPSRTVKIQKVPRLTPDFSFPGAGNKSRTLRSLRGQPVVLLITDTPRNRSFRKQIDRLEPMYSEFAARKVVFIAAFTKEGEGPVKSNLPFVVANNGPAVAAAYNANETFQVIIISQDGNVNYQTDNLLRGERVRDVLQNSYPVQQQTRRGGI
jgi:hypothetical protein